MILNEEVPEEWRFGLSITLAISIAHPSLRLVKVVKTHLEKSQPLLANVRTSYDEFIRLLMVRHRDRFMVHSDVHTGFSSDVFAGQFSGPDEAHR